MRHNTGSVIRKRVSTTNYIAGLKRRILDLLQGVVPGAAKLKIRVNIQTSIACTYGVSFPGSFRHNQNNGLSFPIIIIRS